MSSTWTYCPVCNKPYAHTLGVMGYAGPPFWCECLYNKPVSPVSPVWPNDLQQIVDCPYEKRREILERQFLAGVISESERRTELNQVNRDYRRDHPTQP